ncbi:hypothetical protein [Streptomyces griseocarneus]|uniref:hypothetical protein n=1 Tax=Streptomyces griseocarneus TaxID=51201 RepID=UPI00167CB97A|nr:hypothetical protein [Streptomyces griseocarneus]MBZ6474508.1 hypothetical protein [Streptomyces griseocarneus]GHG67874.1 hypothetical protein GCM10018779_40190 [Streptomyces griseocarneus]
MSEDLNGSICNYKAENFSATAYRGAKGGRRVAVEGYGSCPTPGFGLTLELASPPLVPTPDTLHINLVEKEPDGTVPQVVTETRVEGDFEITDEMEKVLIRNLDITVPITEK